MTDMLDVSCRRQRPQLHRLVPVISLHHSAGTVSVTQGKLLTMDTCFGFDCQPRRNPCAGWPLGRGLATAVEEVRGGRLLTMPRSTD
ncbi:hypothetical protein NP493_62g04000 [Ridgeia piscesae]|uniref:Uncharacterized protein n=1 Tax=Ridgeia piscesae TaxID=27915 RepID=A0AAD9PA89_RIDPI|nr:hypothetical protein NP493_62g04000 [Ridgeia piscesae]